MRHLFVLDISLVEFNMLILFFLLPVYNRSMNLFIYFWRMANTSMLALIMHNVKMPDYAIDLNNMMYMNLN